MSRRLEKGFDEEQGLLSIVGMESGPSPTPGFVGERFGDIDVGVDVADELVDMAGLEAFERCTECIADGETPESGTDAIGVKWVGRQQGSLRRRHAGAPSPTRWNIIEREGFAANQEQHPLGGCCGE